MENGIKTCYDDIKRTAVIVQNNMNTHDFFFFFLLFRFTFLVLTTVGWLVSRRPERLTTLFV